MSAVETKLRLRRDGKQLVAEWTEHLDREDTKALREAFRSALRSQRVDLKDRGEVARFVLEVRGHVRWFDFRDSS